MKIILYPDTCKLNDVPKCILQMQNRPNKFFFLTQPDRTTAYLSYSLCACKQQAVFDLNFLLNQSIYIHSRPAMSSQRSLMFVDSITVYLGVFKDLNFTDWLWSMTGS